MAGWLERALVLLATAATLAVNALAGAGAINDATPGDVANRYDSPFTPAGYVFSIWILIYAGLVAFSVYQFGGAGRGSGRLLRLRPVYVFTCIANMAWLWFWHHYALTAALAVMLMLWAALGFAYHGLAAGQPGSAREAWCVDAVFSLYFAWITVATLANLTIVVASVPGPWPSPDPVAWSQAMILATLAIAAYAGLRLGDPVFLGVIAWAAAGIALKGAQLPGVAVSAMAVAGLAGLGAIGLLLTRDAGAQSTTR